MANSTSRQKMRVLCLVGTRPECIKMAPIIASLNNEEWAEPIVVSTGQHRELTHQTMSIFGVGIDHDLNVMSPDQSLGLLSGRIFLQLDDFLARNACDLVLAQGDTTSVMVTALAAFYRRIPLGHVEAGLRTHDLVRPFPEELNRRIAGLTADLHFAPTRMAQKNLLQENVPSNRIFVTGNTVIDALLTIAKRDLPCGFPKDPKNHLILVTAHRRENFGSSIIEICSAIRDLCIRNNNLEFVYPVHPNPNIRSPVYEELQGLDRIHLIEPVDYDELVALMRAAHIVLTDSGGIQEEAPALHTPVLVLRNETERPEAVDAGVARVVGPNKDRIIIAVEELLYDHAVYERMARGASPYGDGKAARRVVRICHDFLLTDPMMKSESLAQEQM